MIKKQIEEAQHHLSVMQKMEKEVMSSGEKSFDLESHLILLKSCLLAQNNLSCVMHTLAKNTIIDWQRPLNSER
ncbi:hypothetical protein [Pseudomonas huaxiensis]|uniref:hypothetical protein n=1 Tax=Pseudomonas huaxiensis TaxID=2213017 RepID=UPI000DA663EF|nr:hypothetical protein [Pseudomonas huaxiensis]